MTAATPPPQGAAVQADPLSRIRGKSPGTRDLIRSLAVAARADYAVLIEGESGTGKELAARAIHGLSARSDRPFICENCGALPDSLIEAECFGHEKGAFTGAVRQRPGIFELASGGTVFLDEIGELDLSAQRKFLRVLQEKKVRRVGGERLIRVNFRIISATNRNLESMVDEGGFRKDLFYRLNVETIHVPPLRQRVEDIPLLVDHFNEQFAAELGRDLLEFSQRALQALLAYDWPGNVRELRNEVLRLASTHARAVRVESLSRRIMRRTERTRKPAAPQAAPCRSLFELERDTLGQAILTTLYECDGNRTEAARRLGITRSSLYRRLVRYRLFPALSTRGAPPDEKEPRIAAPRSHDH